VLQVVDTVRLLAGAQPTQEQLETYWTRHQTDAPGASAQLKYHYNPDDEPRVLPRYTYRPDSHQGSPQISIEVSLPKLVFGNNHTLLADLDDALEQLDAAISSDPALPPLPPPATTALSRLDLCCSYQVGELLPHYVDALARLTYPRRDTIRINAETVEFRARSIKTKFYDKHAETEGAAPFGTLRHETTYHRARPLKEAFASQTAVTLATITPHLVEAILSQDLARLGIINRPFATRALALSRLCETHGQTRGLRLFGALCAYNEVGKHAAAQQIGISPGSFNRLLSDIRYAGIAPALTDANCELPPLQVRLPRKPPTSQTCIQTPGVTRGSLGSEATTERGEGR
jgi:hypothetical protein